MKATGYITTAERKPEWEELKKQLPEGTPKPDDGSCGGRLHGIHAVAQGPVDLR